MFVIMVGYGTTPQSVSCKLTTETSTQCRSKFRPTQSLDIYIFFPFQSTNVNSENCCLTHLPYLHITSAHKL